MPRDDVTQTQAMPSDPKHIGYAPLDSSDWLTIPDTVQKGLDNTADRMKAHETVTKAARGVADRTATTLSFDAGTRTFTITPVSGPWSYYIAGRRYVKSAAESIVIADTGGPHWIYYDGATLSSVVNANHETVDDLIVNKVRIGIVYWNATDGVGHLVADERHGTVMSGASQEWKHDSIGAVWMLGLSLSGYTLDTDSDAGVDFELTDGRIRDEDLEHDIVDGAPATQYAQQLNGGNAEIPIAYRDDLDGTWTQDAATTLPYKRFGAGRLAYNKDDGDGTWSQVEVTNNRFVLATLVATNDWQYPIKMVQGQAEYTDKKTAIEEANAEQVAWGTMITPEIVPLYRLVMETGDALGGTNKCKIVAATDLRRLSLSGGLAAPAEAHAILNGGTHSDSVAAAVVRGALQVGNATPAWDLLAPGAAGTFLRSAGAGADLTWNNTVVTAAANLTDNRLVRGNGGALGVQTSPVTVSDAGVMGGLTQLDVDNLRFDGNTISTTAGVVLNFTPQTGDAIRFNVVGSATGDIAAWALYNYGWNAAMVDTRTSIYWLQALSAGGVGVGAVDVAAKIVVGTETNWGGAAGTRDAYMAFFTALDGNFASDERMRINSVGAVGIGTTVPGSISPGNIHLDIRREGGRAGLGLYCSHNTIADRGVVFQAGRARGTIGTPAVVEDGDAIFDFSTKGYDGATWRTGSKIKFTVDGIPAVGVMPMSITFDTLGSTRLTIQSDGDILVDADTRVMWRDANLYITSLQDGQLKIYADDYIVLGNHTILAGTSEVRFGDTGTYINQSVDGQLDHVADGEIELTAPIIDLNAASIFASTLASGVDQAGAGAVAGELYVDTNDDNTVKRGV